MPAILEKEEKKKSVPSSKGVTKSSKGEKKHKEKKEKKEKTKKTEEATAAVPEGKPVKEIKTRFSNGTYIRICRRAGIQSVGNSAYNELHALTCKFVHDLIFKSAQILRSANPPRVRIQLADLKEALLSTKMHTATSVPLK